MRTERVNIDQVQNKLADLIAFASEGGEVIIVQNGKPLARLIGVNDPAFISRFLPVMLSSQVTKNLLLGTPTAGRN
jgi:prevent-host-death family protein